MVEVIITSGYLFFNKVLIKLSSSESFALDQIINSRWTYVFIYIYIYEVYLKSYGTGVTNRLFQFHTINYMRSLQNNPSQI